MTPPMTTTLFSETHFDARSRNEDEALELAVAAAEDAASDTCSAIVRLEVGYVVALWGVEDSRSPELITEGE